MIRATQRGFGCIRLFRTRKRGNQAAECHYSEQVSSFGVAGTTTVRSRADGLLSIGLSFLLTGRSGYVGALGAQRIEKTRQAIARSDVGVLVVESARGPSRGEASRGTPPHGIPVLVAVNKAICALPSSTCSA